tara:strand:+ start:1084 stop:2316 length:1233 start_codon:yes stop_codon:yes gene_type:complete
MPKITKRTVDAAVPSEGRWTLWDSEIKGFGVRVTPTGVKTYIARYRVGGGRSGIMRQMVIGRANQLTPDQARKRALQIMAEVASGRDPQANRSADRAQMNLSELCDLYLAEGVATKKASTLALDGIRIERHIKPQIGRLKISEVRKADIERLMRDVASGKVRGDATPRTRGGKGAAARTVGLLGAIFAFAIDRHLVTDNPVRGVKRFPDVKRERFLSPVELGRLGDALAAEIAAGGDWRHVAIIRILALTGARKNEIAHLRKAEIDAAASLARIPDSKTGAKVLRLGAAAMEVIAGLPETEGPYLFPAVRDPSVPLANLDWAWVRIRTRAGLKDVRIHDLRHSFASAAVATGQGLPMIGKLLGHSHVGTTARYAHLADDPVKAAADRISESVAASMLGVSAELHVLGAAQ